MAIQASEDVLFRNLSGEAVLLNLKTGFYFGLNPTGTRMWNLLLESGDLEKTIATLKEEYAVTEAQLRKDLGDLIERLAEKGLLKRGPEISPSAGGIPR